MKTNTSLSIPTKPDLDFITQSLRGKQKTKTQNIAARCPSGHPAVIEVVPIDNDGKPFPTTLWLLCPSLVSQITQIEYAGFAKEVTELIESNQEFKQNLHQAHLDYIALRESLLEDDKFKKTFQKKGIAGSENFSAVKCLHGHFAQQLGQQNNPIGKLLLERFDIQCKLPSNPQEPN